MAPNTPVADLENKTKAQINTFAVLDLETSNLPAHRNNKVSITELCIYAFDSKTIKDNDDFKEPKSDDLTTTLPKKLPTPPRVLHKLNLLFQPSMRIDPQAEEITGLSNYLLERESTLNKNAAQMILNFFEHLPAPVCVVAHNGWGFDFPIVRQAFAKLDLQLPESVLCVDSLRAFMEIDDKRNEELKLSKTMLPELEKELKFVPEEAADILTKSVNWQALNETTPKRPILTRTEAALKRARLADEKEDIVFCSAAKRKPKQLSSRRQLFSGLKCAETKRFPPKGRYNLVSVFQRTFHIPALGAHQAELDVIMLTKLIQHYGVDFLAFSEEQAIPFSNIIPTGGNIYKK